jgi:hypothetical protein
MWPVSGHHREQMNSQSAEGESDEAAGSGEESVFGE